MSTRDRQGSFGPGGAVRATWPFQRTVLAVVHHLTAGTRLADVLPHIESDPRVQVVYTVPPTSPLAASGERWVAELDARVVPWDEVHHHQFQLAVAANHGGLERIDAPVLVLEHGIGSTGSYSPRIPGHGPAASRAPRGYLAAAMVRYGRVIPAAIGVGHVRYRAAITAELPEAEPITHVVGDPCHDRLLASRELRDQYRSALGVRSDQRLVAVSSTWGPGSLLSVRPDLPSRLVRELAGERNRVVLIPHPFVWSWHGRKQVRDWASKAEEAGLRILGPEEGWRAALVAADVVIGDPGSVTFYGAALGKPVLLGAYSANDTVPGSPLASLGGSCPRLQPERPLGPQIARAMLRHSPAEAAAWRSRFTSAPGESAQRLRALMYQMLQLAEPAEPAVTRPLPLPIPLPSARGSVDDVRGVAA